MVLHSGIVTYERISKWWGLLAPVGFAASVAFWFGGQRVEAILGCIMSMLWMYFVVTGDKSTIAEANRAAEPFLRLGFSSIDDTKRREALLDAGHKRDSEHSSSLVLLRGTHRGVEITAILQSVDIHATNREIAGGDTTTLEATVAARPTPFRIGPPLGLGHRAIERGLRAPRSGFADAALEKKWFMYAGAAASAEWLIPVDTLHNPWPEEVWSAGGGLIRATWHGKFAAERAGEAIERFVRTVEWVNEMARQVGADRVGKAPEPP